MLALGAVVAVVGLWSAGRRVERTRYRPDRWRLAEVVVSLSGVLVAGALLRVVRTDLFVAHPGVEIGPDAQRARARRRADRPGAGGRSAAADELGAAGPGAGRASPLTLERERSGAVRS